MGSNTFTPMDIPNRELVMGGTGDWRIGFPSEERHKAVAMTVDVLKNNLTTVSPQETSAYAFALSGIKDLAVQFEARVYALALSPSDYTREISSRLAEFQSSGLFPRATPKRRKISDSS